MPLLQNKRDAELLGLEFDYQSECHCSKTPNRCPWCIVPFDYQSECHCSKTAPRAGVR